MNGLLVSVLAVALAASEPTETRPIRRFALVMGTNDGGPGRTQLRFAASDAEQFARLLEQLGGVNANDRLVLVGPRRSDVLRALSELEHRMKDARSRGERTEALLYYSGHSDEDGLLLGGEQVTYPELRQALARLPADVRIAVLDSCSSGALIRTKGGKRLPPFLVDSSTAVRGHAYLAASAADEAAQESDRIGGSFFTYALLTGLRGAADSTRDGRVTLTEAYQFAYEETLARTEKSRAGPQHPTYDIQLAGMGDLVLTDVRGTSAGLVLGEELSGRITLRNEAGKLVAELSKPAGAPIELGLEPGVYRVTLDSTGNLYRGTVQVADGTRSRLLASQLQKEARETAVALRGAEPVDAVAASTSDTELAGASATKPYRLVPVNVALLPSISVNGPNSDQTLNYLSFNVVGTSGRLEGMALGLGLNTVNQEALGLLAAVGGNITQGPMRGLATSVGFNVAGGPVYGGQLTTGFNWSKGPLVGAQVSTGANVAEDRVTGIQSSIGVNWTQGSLQGVQATTGVNVAAEKSQGIQAAVGANIARSFDGLQVAGVNVAGDGAGAQAGFVNVGGKRRGLMLGFVNVAEDADATVGFVNVVKDGYLRFSVFATDTTVANVALKMGGRYFYSTLGAGAAPSAEPTRWATTFGLGGHLPAGRFFVDLEALGSSLHFGRDWRTEQSVLGTLRAVVGWQLLSHLALIAGPTFNAQVSWVGYEPDISHAPEAVIRSDDGQTTVRLYPGFIAGLQF